LWLPGVSASDVLPVSLPSADAQVASSPDEFPTSRVPHPEPMPLSKTISLTANSGQIFQRSVIAMRSRDPEADRSGTSAFTLSSNHTLSTPRRVTGYGHSLWRPRDQLHDGHVRAQAAPPYLNPGLREPARQPLPVPLRSRPRSALPGPVARPPPTRGTSRWRLRPAWPARRFALPLLPSPDATSTTAVEGPALQSPLASSQPRAPGPSDS
jgi:hypothetical protein